MGKVIPAYDSDNRNHKLIWKHLAYDMKQEDFEAIQQILIEREDDLKDVEESKIIFVEYDKETGLMQPRPIPDSIKQQGIRYVNWSAAFDIWMILSKYAELYSKY